MNLLMCERCKHDTGNVFSEYCRACCFGSKFETNGDPEPEPEIERSCSNCEYNSCPGYAYPCIQCDDYSEFEAKEIKKKTYPLDVGSLYPNLTIDRLNRAFGLRSVAVGNDYMDGGKKMRKSKLPEIKKVIFSNPATIVIWDDGTKTVVKVHGKERFNKEKGLAMAIAKKALGNEGNYYDVFKKWV